MSEAERLLPICNTHVWADLGDPCYCGSDNCAICINCGEDNHD